MPDETKQLDAALLQLTSTVETLRVLQEDCGEVYDFTPMLVEAEEYLRRLRELQARIRMRIETDSNERALRVAGDPGDSVD